MIVKVLQRHIDAGYKGSYRNCPVALALKEKFPDHRSVSVLGHRIRLDEEEYRAGRRLCNFIVEFDKGEEVSPTTFSLKRMPP